MRWSRIGMVVATLVLPLPASAQEGHRLLQLALVLETVHGDLAGAVSVYERILREFHDDRALRAAALAQLGQGYELLGRSEAREAYERLIREFPDQPAHSRAAAAALSRMRTLSKQDPTYVLLGDQAQDDGSWRASQFDFSPDGTEHVVRVVPDSGSPSGALRLAEPGLYVGHRDGRLPRRLVVAGALNGATPQFPRWSHDGRHVAFFTRESADNNSSWLLFVVPASGGTPRRVGGAIAQRIWDLCWTPDGRLAWSANGRIGFRDLEGRSTEVTGDIGSRTILGGFSPDGRWLALARMSPESEHVLDRDVWLMSPVTGGVVRITDRKGLDGFPAWGGIGKLYLVSSRDNARNVWRIDIDPMTGAASGPPRQVTFFQDANVGRIRAAGAGRLGFTLLRSTRTVYLASSGGAGDPVPLVRGQNPVLSPDGTSVFFTVPTSSGEPTASHVLHAIEVSTGANRTLARDLALEGGAGVPGYDVSPDGRTLVYPGRDGPARTLYAVAAAGGMPMALARVPSKNPLFPRFSPDGSAVAFADTQAVYLVAPGGGPPRRVAEVPGGIEPWSVAWSPDGSRIAVFGYPTPAAGGNNAVFVLPADGSGTVRQVSDARDYKEGLAWGPGGDRLTYHLSRRDSRTVQVPSTGGPETPFHDERGVWDYRGTWSPDGQSFYFEAAPDAEPAWRVYQLDLRTGTSRVFARNNASLPRWSRGGAVVWSEAPAVANQLWLLENLP